MLDYRERLSQFSDGLLEVIKLTLRESSKNFDDEIKSYIETCAKDLHNAGIVLSYFTPTSTAWKCDPQILQAVRWYCLSVFGLYNSDMEKYDKAYRSLKATLCTQREYTEEDYGI